MVGGEGASIRSPATPRSTEGNRLSRPPLVEARLPWPRGRFWRPGEPITLTEGGTSITYRLRGVMRDADPESRFATVLLEPVRTVADADSGEDVASAG